MYVILNKEKSPYTRRGAYQILPADAPHTFESLDDAALQAVKIMLARGISDIGIYKLAAVPKHTIYKLYKDKMQKLMEE